MHTGKFIIVLAPSQMPGRFFNVDAVILKSPDPDVIDRFASATVTYPCDDVDDVIEHIVTNWQGWTEDDKEVIEDEVSEWADGPESVLLMRTEIPEPIQFEPIDAAEFVRELSLQ
jgi:hypothetical protein